MKAAEGKSIGGFRKAYRLIALFRVANPDHFFRDFAKKNQDWSVRVQLQHLQNNRKKSG